MKSKNKIIKAGKEHLEQKFTALDSFVKIVNDFKIIPDEEFGDITLFSFNGKKVKAKRINSKICMNLTQLTIYIEGNYNAIIQAFNRHDFIESKHYFTGGDNLSSLKDAKYMTLSGVIRLLKYTRTGYSDQFLDEVTEYIQNNMNPITIGELLLINKERKMIPQYLGDPDREWVADDFDILESRGEQIIDDILLKLKIPHQPKPRIYLPPELEKKFNRDYPIIPDWNIKVTPRCIIEYWGLNTDEYLKNKKKKLEMYKALGLKVINISANEVQNIPFLTEKLMKLLK